MITFLGVLLCGRNRVLAIPVEKKTKALNLLKWAIEKKKVTVKFIQQLTGLLNFLNRVIVPGRVFTRHMYGKLAPKVQGRELKQHHHVWLDREFIMDCHIWRKFLEEDKLNRQLCRPFVDFGPRGTVTDIDLASDASLNPNLGMGVIFGNNWLVARWPVNFIKDYSPSIELLELYALVVAILTWNEDPNLHNSRVLVHCDNQAVVNMINNSASSCRHCMKLLRLLVLNDIRCNRRLFTKHLRTELNVLPDALSRLKFQKLWKFAPNSMNPKPDTINQRLWPINVVCDNEFYQL